MKHDKLQILIKSLWRELNESTSNVCTDVLTRLWCLIPFSNVSAHPVSTIDPSLLFHSLIHSVSPPHAYSRRWLLYSRCPSHQLAYKRLSARPPLNYDNTLQPILILKRWGVVFHTHERSRTFSSSEGRSLSCLFYISKHWRYTMSLNATIDNLH